MGAESATLMNGGQDCSYGNVYPEQYVVYKTAELSELSLSGDLSKKAWEEVAWTKDFVDISTHTAPRLRSRAKMRWDDRQKQLGISKSRGCGQFLDART
ncbi:unnamed protein product [Effrenium voratum]|uniref:Uncharacterized protein n=1 Tax=Effrenium voratum TaxID=2562239 RepID=A0AA36NJR2_9DINO|nr:unnamed protein product [Effrenium voratum]